MRLSFRISTPASKNPHGGKHVTITVRETKTERLTPVNQGMYGTNFALSEIFFLFYKLCSDEKLFVLVW